MTNREKTCSNCRFGNDGICKYINKCVKSSIDPAPSHWKEMTEAQKVEKAMSNIGTKKLVGDISNGYSYANPEMLARIEESKRRAEHGDMLDGMRYSLPIHSEKLFDQEIMVTDSLKQTINSIYGSTNYNKMYNKKEDKNMNIKLYMDEGKWVGDITNPQGLIKNVIFSGPCTIVQWLDGDKTIVRCENEDFDKEKGLAMAIVKKFFGTNESKSNYNDIFKKWIKDEKEEESSDKPEVTLTANVEVDPNTVYLSIKEFAKTAGVSESTIRKQLSKGQYPYAEKVDGKWVIPINKED